MAMPYKFSKTPANIESGVPILGQDNEYILKKYLSYSDEQIKELTERTIISQDPRVAELREKGKI